MNKRLLLLIILVLSCVPLKAAAFFPVVDPSAAQQGRLWADSLMRRMSLRQRIAQLFMVAVQSDANLPRLKKLEDLIAKEQVGGVIVMRGPAIQCAEQLNRLQRRAAVPLLTAIDGEYGPAMRLDSVRPFPRQMQLGAMQDDAYIYAMGKAVAAQCRRFGIYMNFAPVADINNNPDNPVINIRSFGEDKRLVSRKSVAYMQGMQHGGILTCAKHFPGHGDTSLDSHDILPKLDYDGERIDSLELAPFRALVAAGIDAVMMGHLWVAAYDSVVTPASLSVNMTEGLLRHCLNYTGLIFTDALNMRGVSRNYPRDSLCLKALLAGNDILLMPDEITGSIDVIEKAVQAGQLSDSVITLKCRKMLEAKYKVGLNKWKPVKTERLLADLNTTDNEALCLRLAEASVTLAWNKDSLLPLKRLDTLSMAYLEVGKDRGAPFREQLCRYAGLTSFTVEADAPQPVLDSLYQALAPFNLVIVGYHDSDIRPFCRFGVDSVFAGFLHRVAAEKRMIVDFFGVPYGLSRFEDPKAFSAIIVSYQNTPALQQRSAQLIFGGIAPRGTLPVSTPGFPAGTGLGWPSPVRLKYVLPEEIGIPAARLAEIDALMQEAIAKHATPGGQIIAIYDGQVFYDKAFGRQTYDSASPLIDSNTLYDLASLTKVTATLPALMSLVSADRLDINKRLGDYLPLKAYKDKKQLSLTDILAHRSGLPAFHPFQESFVRDGRLDSLYLTIRDRAGFDLPVAGGLFASKAVPVAIYRHINTTPLMTRSYRYSDWGFIYLQQVVEAVSGAPLDRLADSLLYAPLGMAQTGFLPLRRFRVENIAPTENDLYFRKQLLQGYVHDPTAALLGGVAGHAGLFGTATDLAKLLQLYLNNGTYGGERYMDSAVVAQFTSCPFCNKGNRRGLGFDKPEPSPDKASPVGRDASLSSYGHSGYTGTFFWVDPQRKLVYIFLSNRVYPSDDKKLNSLSTRTRILSVLNKILDER